MLLTTICALVAFTAAFAQDAAVAVDKSTTQSAAVSKDVDVSKTGSPTENLVLTVDNTLVLDVAVTDDSVTALIGEARRLDSTLPSGYPIYLFLNTPGGSIQAGMELIQFLKSLNRPVNTVTLFAASMGFQIAQNLGQRYITEFGVLMSHKAAGGFRGEFGGDSSQIDSRYGMWLRRLNQLDKVTVKRTNGKKTLEQYRREYDNELWLNGEEGVIEGYADAVVNVRCDSTLSGTRDQEVNFLGFRFMISVDKCPTRTGVVEVKAEIRTNHGAYMSVAEFMAKGGKFGENCRQEDVAPSYNYTGEKTSDGKGRELCALDTKITFEDIKKQQSKIKNQVSNKKGNVIKMNFRSFINEEELPSEE
jgi:ATP-dependent Clp protease protease subunit